MSEQSLLLERMYGISAVGFGLREEFSAGENIRELNPSQKAANASHRAWHHDSKLGGVVGSSHGVMKGKLHRKAQVAHIEAAKHYEKQGVPEEKFSFNLADTPAHRRMMASKHGRRAEFHEASPLKRRGPASPK